jgi:Flp pilus assembly protein TadG
LNRRTILLWFSLSRQSRDDRAAQIVEFAVALPLMVVFVVGIFDFSGAFTLKQKLTNVARDAARSAAAGPTNDLTLPITAVPISVNDAAQIVDNYLIANHLGDCGFDPATAAAAGLTWTYTASTGCLAPGLTVVVNRGYYFAAASGGQPAGLTCVSPGAGAVTAVISTCVSIQYPYQWRFGRVASLLGAATALPMQVNATAVAMNEN